MQRPKFCQQFPPNSKLGDAWVKAFLVYQYTCKLNIYRASQNSDSVRDFLQKACIHCSDDQIQQRLGPPEPSSHHFGHFFC